jgi:hypothetical protein
MAAEVTITGDVELDRKFRELPIKVEKKVLRDALRPAAKVILDAARALAPSRSGLLKGSLKVRAQGRSRRRPNAVGFVVQTAEGDYKGETFYGAFLMLGHRLGSRKLGNRRRLIAGKNFLRQALDTSGEAAKADALERIKEGIEREASAG